MSEILARIPAEQLQPLIEEFVQLKARFPVPPGTTCEDLVQSAIESLLEKLSTGQVRYDSEIGPYRSFLFGHLHQEFLWAWTRCWRVHRREVRRQSLVAVRPVLDERPRRQHSELIDDLQHKLASLPAEDRRLLTLHYLEGHSYRDIAQDFEQSRTVLNERTRTALHRLRSRMTA